MKVMVIVKASKSSEAGEMPSPELLTAMGKFNEELANAGLLLDGAGLTPSSKGARVRFSGTKRTVIDGPFTAKLPPDFTSLKLIARRNAVFVHSGHVSAIAQTIDTIWSKWSPESGLKVADAPCFERYTSEFDPRTGLGGMEIWIPLEAN